MSKRTSGIENEVLYSRESETKEPSRNIIKLCAFTLAEVLITLAIIGVVAALTIPVLVQKYQNKQFYTQFMKTYNTLSNAIDMAQAENGSILSWGAYYANTIEENYEIYNKNLFQYLRIQKVCSSASDCGISNNLMISVLNVPDGSKDDYGDDMETKIPYLELFPINDQYYINPIILSDGSLVQIYMASSGWGIGDIYIDTNGIKGPNTIGRDIFLIPVSKQKEFIVLGDNLPTSEIEAGCSTTQVSYGQTCALKLLIDGKMDY